MTPKLAVRGVSKRFGDVVALQNVSLAFEPGSRVALVGENGAGKSSLMNVLYGLYRPDSGEVLLNDQPVRWRSPRDALAHGIGMVHQHFTLVPTLTVLENVVLGHEPTRFGILQLKQVEASIRATCQRLGFDLTLSAPVNRLTVGAQQKVEIVKALHHGAKILILDEPSAVLTPDEAVELFALVQRLSREGVTVLLVSHKLPEVLQFAQQVAVLRRGQLVATVDASSTDAAGLAQLMVDAPVAVPQRAQKQPTGLQPLLSLNHINAGLLKNISLNLHPGEIVGIVGVDGNGQRELALVCTGLLKPSAGTIVVRGKEQLLTPPSARSQGIAHIPEDRLSRAMVGQMTVEENVALGHEANAPFAKGWRIDTMGRRACTQALIQAADVRPANALAYAGALSGGNQQKLVVVRELSSRPDIVVAVQPTRGLDLAAAAQVRQQLLDVAARDGAVLLLSLDRDEVRMLADRLVVLFDGRVTLAGANEDVDDASLGRAMLGAALTPR